MLFCCLLEFLPVFFVFFFFFFFVFCFRLTFRPPPDATLLLLLLVLMIIACAELWRTWWTIAFMSTSLSACTSGDSTGCAVCFFDNDELDGVLPEEEEGGEEGKDEVEDEEEAAEVGCARGIVDRFSTASSGAASGGRKLFGR